MDEIMIYIPEIATFMAIQEGSGDNILKEEDEKIVDYLDIQTFVLEDRQLVEDDGGEYMLTELVQNYYSTTHGIIDYGRVIKDSMNFMFGRIFDEYVIIEEKDLEEKEK